MNECVSVSVSVFVEDLVAFWGFGRGKSSLRCKWDCQGKMPRLKEVG